MSDTAPALTVVPARTSPLHTRHLSLGARMADFGGWDMPIEYPGGGVVAEHTAVRTAVGVFDVSHLGKARVSGPGAVDAVNALFTNDLRRIGPGQAQYTMCCDETGGVVDDLIAYLLSDDDVFLIPNAANTAEVVRRVERALPEEVTVTNLHDAYGVIAVQGPRSDEVLEALGLPTGHDYMSFVEVDWQGAPLIVCRTGYTGERGYELLPAWEGATALWDALLEAAAPYGGLPCGLGARDTLRTEMGYPSTARTSRSTSRRCRPGRAGRSGGPRSPSGEGRPGRREDDRTSAGLARAARHGPRHPPGALWRVRRRGACRGGDLGDLLPDPQAGRRPGAARALGRGG